MLYFEKITAEKAPNNNDPMQFYPKYAVKPYQYPGYIAILVTFQRELQTVFIKVIIDFVMISIINAYLFFL